MPMQPLRSVLRGLPRTRGPAAAAGFTASFHTSLATQSIRRRAAQQNPSSAPGSPPPARGPDFKSLDILGDTPAPSTSVDICMSNGFRLNNGVQVSNGDGILLVGGEAFSWRPWVQREKRLVNAKGQWEVDSSAFDLLGLVWPRPGKPTPGDLGHESELQP